MPNWVAHEVRVSGPEKDIVRFLSRCFEPDDECASRLNFSFGAVIPLADAGGDFSTDDALEAWGTRREAFETDIADRDKGMIRFKFLSATFSPMPVFRQLATDYPDLTFDIAVLEDQGLACLGTIARQVLNFIETPDWMAVYVRIYDEPPQFSGGDS
ncbi:MAG: hypothetical protein ACXIVF_11995 [Rhizobiaceae bacterium]